MFIIIVNIRSISISSLEPILISYIISLESISIISSLEPILVPYLHLSENKIRQKENKTQIRSKIENKIHFQRKNQNKISSN